jgi:ABC-type branched-subunit amino acid transport system substrate-binding protein
MEDKMQRLLKLIACTGGILLVTIAGASAARTHRLATDPTNASVVVPHGQPVQIALADDLTGVVAAYGPSVENAVRLAIVAHPDIHGFPIRLNVVDTPCGDPAADAAAASAIVANTQNAGVLGQLCTDGFDQALPIYQQAGIVVISGSATGDALPALGPTVFNRTAVSDGDGGTAWYAQIKALPDDLAWRGAYVDLFGTPPMDYADLYYDATKVLIRKLQATAFVNANGNLVINRALLASAVRHTTSLNGITCTLTIDPKTGNRVNDPNALTQCARS